MSAQDLVAAGLTYRQVDHWIRVGYLRAQPRKKAKSGVPRAFPDTELEVARVMALCVKAGLLPEAAHKVARGVPLPGGVQVTVPPPITTRYRKPDTAETTGGVL